MPNKQCAQNNECAPDNLILQYVTSKKTRKQALKHVRIDGIAPQKD